jgi:hypothetical protein
MATHDTVSNSIAPIDTQNLWVLGDRFRNLKGGLQRLIDGWPFQIQAFPEHS